MDDSVVVSPRGSRGVNIPFPKWFIAAGNRLAVFIQRRTGGRMKMNGAPLLVVTTVGAKSGQERRSMLAQFQEPDGSTLVVASFGGAPQHPAWYFNLAKHPDQVWIERDGRRVRVQARSLRGAERDQAWQRIVSIAPGFGEYQRKTDREIPVVRLTPVA